MNGAGKRVHGAGSFAPSADSAWEAGAAGGDLAASARSGGVLGRGGVDGLRAGFEGDHSGVEVAEDADGLIALPRTASVPEVDGNGLGCHPPAKRWRANGAPDSGNILSGVHGR